MKWLSASVQLVGDGLESAAMAQYWNRLLAARIDLFGFIRLVLSREAKR